MFLENLLLQSNEEILFCLVKQVEIEKAAGMEGLKN